MDKIKTYIIAEIGINYNGNLENIFKLIDSVSVSGADAAKFQFFKAKRLYPRSAGKLLWRDTEKSYKYDIYSAAKRLELPGSWIKEIIGYCRAKKVDFIASVFDKKGADYLLERGMKKIKIASYVLTNIPLIEHCAKAGVPLIISTGGSTMAETEEAVSAVNRYHNKLSLLHCSIKYPTELNECNLGVIETLGRAFPQAKIGFSDHTSEIYSAAVQAVYLGAQVIEKHITLDRTMKGPDHFFSLEPKKLKEMVSRIRKAEYERRTGQYKVNRDIYGNTARITYPHEKYLRDFAYMRLYAARDVKSGQRIKALDISILRSGKKGHGLEPKYLNIFQKNIVTARKDLRFEDPITWGCFLK